jgi:hypothetical protein
VLSILCNLSLTESLIFKTQMMFLSLNIFGGLGAIQCVFLLLIAHADAFLQSHQLFAEEPQSRVLNPVFPLLL